MRAGAIIPDDRGGIGIEPYCGKKSRDDIVSSLLRFSYLFFYFFSGEWSTSSTKP